MYRYILGAVLAIGSVSCTTLVERSVEVPSSMLTMFDDCRALEGAGSFFISNDEFSTSFEVEWMRMSDVGQVRVYSPTGQTIAKIISDNSRFRVDGKLSEYSKKIRIDEKGFLIFDDSFLGVKENELFCFLNQKLPKSWLRNVKGVQNLPSGAVLEITDEDRNVEIIRSTTYACAEISWYQFFIFPIELTICHRFDQKESTVSLRDLEVRWLLE